MKTEGLIVRRMEAGDLDEVARIEAVNFSRPWSRQGFEDSYQRPDADFLVAEEEGKILGYIGFYGSMDEGDITNVSVDPAAQGRGVGAALVARLIEVSLDRGIQRIFLEVRESNEPAIHVYTKAGFTRVGLRKDYYAAPKENAIIMMRNEEELRNV